MNIRILFSLFLLWTIVCPQAKEYKVIYRDSVLSVITHKAGLASGLAHNHFVHARLYKAKINYDPKSRKKLTFSCFLWAVNLEADVPTMHKKWYPEIKKLGILVEPFSTISDSDRKKIKKTLLSDEQIDEKKYPKITAKVLYIEDVKSKMGERNFTQQARVEVNIHGKKVRKNIPVKIRLYKTGVLELEAVGKFKFTEFNMSPYSAFFGAVKNQNDFHIYVKIRAK